MKDTLPITNFHSVSFVVVLKSSLVKYDILKRPNDPRLNAFRIFFRILGENGQKKIETTVFSFSFDSLIP